ncbi:MAG TPA: VWA domain-containing protein [Thermoanaerobaculia bacterium]|nr:VWA domain-containing protein [Thermoanaerobaculia bacterium]
MRYRIQLFALFLLAAILPLSPLGAQGLEDNDPTLWPEPERAFYQDGPGLLLSPEQRTALRGFNPEARARWIQELLDKDPIPETPANELREGVALRQRLATDQYLSPRDVRSQLLFLNGLPEDRLQVDCAAVFKPLEVWTYPGGGTGPDGKLLKRQLLVYSPGQGQPFRLWIPSDSKRSLYTPLMEYWLQQWEELRGRIRAVRFDLQNCKEAKQVDQVTGVPGLTGALEGGGDRIRPRDASKFIAPPADLARWAREAVATEMPALAPPLKIATAQMRFPARAGQRLVARALIALPPDAGFKPSEGGDRLLRLVVEGLIEQEGQEFESFRMRFQVPPPKGAEPVVLAIDQPLRPKANYVVRLRIRDEVSGSEAWLSRGFRVPTEPVPEAMPASAAAGQLVPATAAAGPDSLLLLPPAEDILMGLWRAEAIVTGERIKKVAFLVDGKAQLTSSKRPFSAELRLERFPTEQTVRVEGFDGEGKLVAADEVILNQPRGSLNVRIVSPSKGTKVQGRSTKARAEVVVPDGRRIKSVEFRVNDAPVSSLAQPPWEAEVPVPDADLVYLTVVATLDDGSRAEAVRYLKSPQFVSEVEVNLVEMYVAVTDRSGNFVTDLKQGDFEVFESEKPQEIAKFELVQNLPLVVGILLDTSGSMAGSMVDTEKAAAGFLESVITPKDKAFAVSFARRPSLVMPPTDDVGAVTQAIEGLQAVGDTALHDALVHSLYYFRGVQGQRALVVLSDGDDNASYINYKDAMEYARRSGVAIYTIGLNIPLLEPGIRGKLNELAEATGGRTFFAKTEELPGIYKQIETELRSRYLVAYNSNETNGQPGFRPVEVKLKKGGLKSRTARGYFP